MSSSFLGDGVALVCVRSFLSLGDFQEEVFKPGYKDKTTPVFYLFSTKLKFLVLCVVVTFSFEQLFTYL